MRQSRTKKAGIALAAGVMAFLMVSSPLTVRAAEPWDMENGQYVDAAGTPITDHRSPTPVTDRLFMRITNG